MRGHLEVARHLAKEGENVHDPHFDNPIVEIQVAVQKGDTNVILTQNEEDSIQIYVKTGSAANKEDSDAETEENGNTESFNRAADNRLIFLIDQQIILQERQ